MRRPKPSRPRLRRRTCSLHSRSAYGGRQTRAPAGQDPIPPRQSVIEELGEPLIRRLPLSDKKYRMIYLQG